MEASHNSRECNQTLSPPRRLGEAHITSAEQCSEDHDEDVLVTSEVGLSSYRRRIVSGNEGEDRSKDVVLSEVSFSKPSWMGG